MEKTIISHKWLLLLLLFLSIVLKYLDSFFKPPRECQCNTQKGPLCQYITTDSDKYQDLSWMTIGYISS